MYAFFKKQDKQEEKKEKEKLRSNDSAIGNGGKQVSHHDPPIFVLTKHNGVSKKIPSTTTKRKDSVKAPVFAHMQQL